MRSLFIALLVLPACVAEPLGERVIEVRLDYDDRTNTGSETARGTATLDTASGMVLLQADGLSELEDDERYEGWLRGGDESPHSLGRFEADGVGAASLGAIVPGLSESTFTRVELTVEPEPDSSSEPSVRVSIGGDIE